MPHCPACSFRSRKNASQHRRKPRDRNNKVDQTEGRLHSKCQRPRNPLRRPLRLPLQRTDRSRWVRSFRGGSTKACKARSAPCQAEGGRAHRRSWTACISPNRSGRASCKVLPAEANRYPGGQRGSGRVLTPSATVRTHLRLHHSKHNNKEVQRRLPTLRPSHY